MPSHRDTRLILAALLLVVLATPFTLSGDLEPPGPPEPTMKTIDQVEPRRPIFAEQLPLIIDESGSYYLAENAEGVTWGIKITASDVTLDLRGFSLYGGSGTGIEATAPRVIVENGIVRDWGSFGILLSDDSIVRDVLVESNGAMGIEVGWDSLVSGCVARNNGTDGIKVTSGLVRDCVASENSSNGIVGLHAVTIRGCVASVNDRNGIKVWEDSFVVGNTTYSNGTAADPKAGIYCTGNRNRIEDNNSSLNKSYGFQADVSGSSFFRNSAAGNLSANYNLASGNDVGPIGTAATSTSPWANISY